MSGLGSILQLAGPHKRTLAWAGAFSILDSLLDLATYYIMYLVVLACMGSMGSMGSSNTHPSGATPPSDVASVWPLALLALAAVAGRAFARWRAGTLAHRAGYGTLCEIRRNIAQHMGRLPMLFFSQRTSGNLQKVMIEDVERIETLLCHHIPDLCAAAATPLLTLGLFFWLDWPLALAALIPLVLAVLCQVLMFRESAGRMNDFHNSMSTMNSTIVEYVQGIMDIKAFNQTVQSFTRFRDSVRRFEHVVSDWSRISGKYYALFGTMLGAGILFVLPPALVQLSRHSLTVADLILFLMLTVGYAVPLDRLLRFAGKLQEISLGVQRIEEVMQTPVLSHPDQPSVPQTFDIEFDGVTFAYDATSPLFSNLSLRLPAKTLTAFVGPSGTGKTTLATLASRYQDVQQGAIRIGGVDVRDIAPEKLMDMVSFVFQDTFLFTDSVLENIRAGRSEASREQIMDAARKARAHDFIMRLPDGYDTVVGDGGVPLSGGERQRISIARAVLRDTPIVILDEATAYADPENEALLQEAVGELLQGKTVIVIGHRLQALTEADALVVFDRTAQGSDAPQTTQGSFIAGTGSHQELLENCPLYQRMWDVQTQASGWSLAARNTIPEHDANAQDANAQDLGTGEVCNAQSA
ncbi:MAG: ABC transporter ATP-binding protein [Desulfovibrio sp.]|uniref:ABC transporter ATP-binding protein n=1 Tax=Desulfovibrio sp. 7SRBS1 TaxID=3378064 RepID=UPI003B3EA025